MIAVLALVLLFLIKIRFPRNTSVADIIRRRYGDPVLKLYRAMERLDYKVRKIKCDVDFLTACQQQDLLPKFLQFKLYDRSLHQTRLYRNCQRQFLRRELKSKEHLLKVSTSRLASLTSELRSVVTWIDYNHLASLVERTNCTTISRVKFVQDNKLRGLGLC